MRQFFVHNGQNEEGPFNIEHLQTIQLKKDTPIWYEGLDNWTTADKIEELKFLLRSETYPPKFENLTQKNTAYNSGLW